MRRRPANYENDNATFLPRNQSRLVISKRGDEEVGWYHRLNCTREKIIILSLFTFIIAVQILLSIVVKPKGESMESWQIQDLQSDMIQSGGMQNEMRLSIEAENHKDFYELLKLHDAEEAFLRTLKSSDPMVLPTSPQDEINSERNIRPKKDTPVKRIGILAPPGYVSTMVSKWIKRQVIEFKSSSNSTQALIKVDVISTSHAPPYGYGKNHGWHKIIRLTTLPVFFGVADAMLFLLASNSIDIYDDTNALDGDLMISTLSGMLRQYVRWHCRLSHVASHTAVHTVNLCPESLLVNPEDIIQDVVNFIFELPRDAQLIGDIPIVFPDEERLKLSRDIQNIERFVNHKLQYNEEGDMKDCDSATQSYQCILQEELDSTNQLQAWPCRSLWENNPRRQTGVTDMNKDGVSRSNLHDFLLFQMASRLGPDCQAYQVKCTIQKDLCEEASDLSLCSPP